MPVLPAPEFTIESTRASHPWQDCYGPYTREHFMWALNTVQRVFLRVWRDVDV